VISFIHHLRDFGHCRGFLVQSRSPGFFTCGVNNLLHFTSDSLRPSVSSSASHDFKPLCLALTSVVDRLWWCLQRRKSNPASGSTVGGDIELFISHNRYEPDLNPHLRSQLSFALAIPLSRTLGTLEIELFESRSVFAQPLQSLLAKHHLSPELSTNWYLFRRLPPLSSLVALRV
jgi:hypothetical protein